jgi:hypothetical protein
MNDAVLVRGFKRQGDLPRDRNRFIDGKRSTMQSIGKCFAVNQFKHQRRRRRGLLETVDVGDVWMIEGGQHLRFARKALNAIGISGNSRQQHLDGYIAMQSRVSRAIDLPHAAGTESRNNLIRTDPRAGRERNAASISDVIGNPATAGTDNST